MYKIKDPDSISGICSCISAAGTVSSRSSLSAGCDAGDVEGLYYGTAESAFLIAKRPVTVTAKDQTVEAGEDILTGTDQVVLEGAANGHCLISAELTAGNTAKVTANGKIKVSGAVITDGTADVTANYSITYQKGTLTVTEKETEPEPKKEEETKKPEEPKKEEETKKQEEAKEPEETKTPEEKQPYTLLVSMKARGKTSLKLSWTKIPEASGYDIYMALCNTQGKRNKYKCVKTIQKSVTVSWTRKNLKKKTSYKAYIKAFTKVNGKKKYLAKSPAVHAYTSGGDAKYTNPKSIKLKSSASVTLKAGQYSRIRAAVKKQNSNKKIRQCTDDLRFVSTDPAIVDVSLSGRILAKRPGKAYVYVFAENGVRKRVTVTVK